MATLAIPMQAVPASVQDLPVAVHDLRTQAKEPAPHREQALGPSQETPATTQEISAEEARAPPCDVPVAVEQTQEAVEEKPISVQETPSAIQDMPTKAEETRGLTQGLSVSIDEMAAAPKETSAEVQEIPIPVQVPAKHFVITSTVPMDASETTLPPHAVAVSPISPPSSYFKPIHHPKMDEVSREVDSYFLEHWPFKNEKARKKFVDAGFSRVTCLYFPEALDDRIHFACRLLTILFLIDGNTPSLPLPVHHLLF